MKKFYIETYGCQMNVADSEVVAAIMETTEAQLTEQWEELPQYFITSATTRLGREELLDYIEKINKTL